MEPVIKWEGNIHQNKLWVLGNKTLQHLLKILHACRFITPSFHMLLDRFGNYFIIFYNQQLIHLAPCSSFCPYFSRHCLSYGNVPEGVLIIGKSTCRPCSKWILSSSM
jgi:hypothetical protein